VIRLDVKDGADGNGADAQGVVAAAAALCEVLSKHLDWPPIDREKAPRRDIPSGAVAGW
jgi:ribosomal protein S12 methylthiotransferase accessory factor YcaO